MARRSERAAQAAADQASEAARVLQQRAQESKAERIESVEPAAVEQAPKVPKAQPKEEQAPLEPEARERMLGRRPHVQAMDDIIARRGLNGPKDEDAAPIEEKPAKEPKVEAPKADEPEAPAFEAAPEAVAEAPAEAPAVKMVKQKVDGEEYDVPQDEIDAAGGERAWRMQKASDNRLKEAKEAREESKKLMSTLTSLLQQQAPKQQQAQPEKPEDVVKALAAKMQTLRFGDDAEAAQFLVEAVNKLTPKQHDPMAIIAAAETRINWRNAMQAFTKEFPEVVANPLLTTLVESLDQKARAQFKPGQVVDWHNHYRTIGNQIRTLVPAGQSQPAASADKTASHPSQQSDKEARKASIVTLPTASARAQAPKEEKVPTPEEARQQWIADEKKRRGQAG